MPKQSIFISHSTKADEPAAEMFLDAVEAAIKAHSDQFDLKVDRLKLEPGDDWRHQLYEWMDQADGAVVIIGRNALESNFVPIELSYLSIRAELDKTFQLIPVQLPDINREDVKAGVAGALDLMRLQFVREKTAEAAAEKVIERLLEMYGDASLCLSRWQTELIRKIGNELEGLKLCQAELEEVGGRLGWEEVRRSFRTPAHIRFAAHLALAPPDEAERALTALKSKLGAPSHRLQNVFWNLLPQWIVGGITPDAAERLGMVVLGPTADRQLSFDLHMYEPHTIDEAVCLSRWTIDGARRRRADMPIRPVLVPPPGYETDLEQQLQKVLRKHHNIGHARRRAKRLRKENEDGDHLVLLLDPASYPPTQQILTSIRAIAEPVTIVFLDWQKPPTTETKWPCMRLDQKFDDIANIYESCATKLDIELYAESE